MDQPVPSQLAPSPPCVVGFQAGGKGFVKLEARCCGLASREEMVSIPGMYSGFFLSTLVYFVDLLEFFLAIAKIFL
jgi:hypothetical protein